MRSVLLMMVCLMPLLASGCVKNEKPALVIGSIKIPAAEFDAAYQDAKVQMSRELSREEFLEMYINRKLFLKEAETLGLDKDPQFLLGLQLFWEQSLMKSVIARKLNESTLIIRVSDNEIAEYFERHKDTDFSGKTLPEVRNQIKVLLFQVKQKLELQHWMKTLRSGAKVSIDHDMLRVEPDIKEAQ